MSINESYYIFVIKFNEIQAGCSADLTPSIRVKIPEIKEHKMFKYILHKVFTKHKLENYNFVFSIDNQYLKYLDCIFELPTKKCAILINMFSALIAHSVQKRNLFLIDKNNLWNIGYFISPSKLVDKVLETEEEVLQEIEEQKCVNIMLLGEVKKDEEFKERIIRFFKDSKDITFVENKDFEVFMGASIFSSLKYARENMMFTKSEYIENKDKIIKTWCWF